MAARTGAIDLMMGSLVRTWSPCPWSIFSSGDWVSGQLASIHPTAWALGRRLGDCSLVRVPCWPGSTLLDSLCTEGMAQTPL
jgi:hypothetical protein